MARRWLWLWALVGAGPVFGAPVNDDFAGAEILASETATAAGTNVGAGAEVGEPDHVTGSPADQSVWWKLTASVSGWLEVSTDGSDFDTELAVYRGTGLGDLEKLGEADDTASIGTVSRAIFFTEAGAEYWFAVDGAGGATGNVVLNVLPPPNRNDEFGLRIHLTGTDLADVQSNEQASSSLFEPAHVADSPAAKSIWWEWTAPADGWVEVDSRGSSFDTVTAVYTGSVIIIGNSDTFFRNDASSVPVNEYDISDDDNGRVKFWATSGTAYQIVVDGWQGDSGMVQLHIEMTASAPPNDNFVDRVALAGNLIAWSGSSVGASVELGEPDHNPNDFVTAQASIWFEWSSSDVDRKLVIDTDGSDFDTMLGLYSKEDDTLIVWKNNDDDPNGSGVTSRIEWNADKGRLYQIAVDGYSGEQGSVVLNISATEHLNDLFAESVTKTGITWSAHADSSTASAEVGEPEHVPGVPPSRSMWWTWMAPFTGDVAITTLGTGYDAVLAVYTGSAVDALTLVAADDDGAGGGQASLVLSATAGTVYRIAVDSKAGAGGITALHLDTLGTYQKWLAEHPGLDEPAEQSPNADPDGDGFPNRIEAALGLDPLLNSGPQGSDPNRDAAPTLVSTYPDYVFTFRIDPAYTHLNPTTVSPKILLIGQRSGDGLNWFRLTPTHVSGDTYQIVYPVSQVSNVFQLLRLKTFDSPVK